VKSVIYSTFVVGPDGREYDLAKRPFPSHENYIAVNAFTRAVRESILPAPAAEEADPVEASSREGRERDG
jgi:hypothetical protein